jgi:putative ATPase
MDDYRAANRLQKRGVRADKMTQNSLKFGMSKEDIKKTLQEKKAKEKKTAVKEKYREIGYDQKDVVSALIKDMRLGNQEGAMYWARVMEEAGDLSKLCRRLLIFAFEDGFGEQIQMYSAACWQAWQAVRDNNIWFAWVERICRATKFWEVREGEEREKAYDKADRELKEGKKRPIPDYAKDMHCKAGYEMKKEKGYMDTRFSGDDYGRWQMIQMYKKLGRLDPADGESLEELKK